MGGEIGQWAEWNHDTSLDWHLLERPGHGGIALWLKDLNRLYAEEPALHVLDFDPRGFEWIDCHDADHSVVSLERRGTGPRERIAAVFNFTPVPRQGDRVGLPQAGPYRELLNSDAEAYGGSNMGNAGWINSEAIPSQGQPHRLCLTLPPLACIVLKAEGR